MAFYTKLFSGRGDKDNGDDGNSGNGRGVPNPDEAAAKPAAPPTAPPAREAGTRSQQAKIKSIQPTDEIGIKAGTHKDFEREMKALLNQDEASRMRKDRMGDPTEA